MPGVVAQQGRRALSVICSNCGKGGHDKDHCWKLYPTRCPCICNILCRQVQVGHPTLSSKCIPQGRSHSNIGHRCMQRTVTYPPRLLLC